MISNANVAKVIKEKQGYRVVIGGEVCRKHCITQADATRYIHKVQQGLVRIESMGREMVKGPT